MCSDIGFAYVLGFVICAVGCTFEDNCSAATLIFVDNLPAAAVNDFCKSHVLISSLESFSMNICCGAYLLLINGLIE